MEVLRMKDSLTVFFLFPKKVDLSVSYATESCENFFNGLFIQPSRYLSFDRCHAIFSCLRVSA